MHVGPQEGTSQVSPARANLSGDSPAYFAKARAGIVKLSEFDQKRGKTRIHNSLIVQHSGCGPEVENQPKLT